MEHSTRYRMAFGLAFALIATMGLCLSGLSGAGPSAQAVAEALKQGGNAPGADYGDAPDLSDDDFNNAGAAPSATSGQFPTLYDTGNTLPNRRGPFHLNTGDEILGLSATGDSVDTETDADVINQDAFDDGFRGFFFLAVQIPIPTWAIWEVSVDSNAPDTTRYMNMVIDLNQDGQWGLQSGAAGAPEHVIVNEPVNVPPGASDIVTFGPFAYGTGVLFAYPAWLRGTLTRSQIDLPPFNNVSEWDGSGPDAGFANGETEDYYFRFRGGDGDGDGDGDPKDNVIIKWMPRRVIVPEGGTYFWIKLCNRNDEEITIDLSWAIEQLASNSSVGFQGEDGTQIPPADALTITIPGRRCIWYRLCVFWLEGREGNTLRRALGFPQIDPPFASSLTFEEPADSQNEFSMGGQLMSRQGAMLTAAFPVDFGAFSGQAEPPPFFLRDLEAIPNPDAVNEPAKQNGDASVVYAVEMAPDAGATFDPTALLELPMIQEAFADAGLDPATAFPVEYDPGDGEWNPHTPYDEAGQDEQPHYLGQDGTLAFEVTAQGTFGIAATPATTGASPVTLNPDKDVTLYEDPEGDVANGSGQFLFAGRTNQDALRRAILHFDVAGALPEGATVTSATLQLEMDRESQADASPVLELRSATLDWGEGASDAPDSGPGSNEGIGTNAETGDATWVHTFFDTDQWTNAGGDFSDTVLASQTVSSPGTYQWTSPDLASAVQSWLDNPAANHGLFLLGGEDTTGSAKRVISKDSADTSARPKLVVEFTMGLPGDVDNDGDVDAIDIQLVINAALGFDVGDGVEPDVDGDGDVDAIDIQLVINAVLGIEIGPF